MPRTPKGKNTKDAPNDDPDFSDTNGEKDDEVESNISEDSTKKNNSGQRRSSKKKIDDDEEDEELRSTRKRKNVNYISKESDDESDPMENESDKPAEKIEQNGKAVKGKKKAKVSPKVVKKDVEEEPKEPEEYEVEKIVGQRVLKGKRQFLVRWKGYTENDDTWEQEKDLSCDSLIKEFLESQDEKQDDENDKPVKTEKKGKSAKTKKPAKKAAAKKGPSKAKTDLPEGEKSGEEDADDSKEYEVEKIIEVHFKKDKKRDFLVRWKGFTSKDDTWEPEEHLNCADLIEKFMEKLDKIKNVDMHELRENPKHTKRYTLPMHADKRVSRRNVNKERATYYECD